MVDMFVTEMSKLPINVSPVPDPNAMTVDVLNISWEALDGDAYCPIALIPKIIQKMKTFNISISMFGIWIRDKITSKILKVSGRKN